MKDYYSTSEYASVVGVSRVTVLAWCREGDLPAAYLVGTRWRIPVGTPPPARARRDTQQPDKETPKAKGLAVVY